MQVRDKDTPVRDLGTDLKQCVEFAREHDVVLIVNDRCDLALIAGAAGVHLGQHDIPPCAARLLLGRDRIVGYSTHNLQQVEESESEDADYIGFGPVFASPTKPGENPQTGLEGLRRACAGSSKPVVAIGGIGLNEVREVLEAGAASAALISALMIPEEIASRMEVFLRATETI